MVDVVDRKTRSRMMAGIRGKDTKPEYIIRRGLHARGFRYRLHVTGLPGCPDLVLPRYRAVIFVHGCFWHGHDCNLFKWPSTRPDWWREKIGKNRQRDALVRADIAKAGWRQARVWECAIKGRYRRSVDDVIDSLAGWLSSDVQEITIRGTD